MQRPVTFRVRICFHLQRQSVLGQVLFSFECCNQIYHLSRGCLKLNLHRNGIYKMSAHFNIRKYLRKMWEINYLIEQVEEIYIVCLVSEVVFENSRDVIAKQNPIICCNKTNLQSSLSKSILLTTETKMIVVNNMLIVPTLGNLNQQG
jgi:hypothetical protein